MDFISIFNRVLRTSGRHSVTNVELDNMELNEDQRMVLDMVNDKYEQIFKEYPWLTTTHDDTFQTEEGTPVYTLTGKPEHPVDPTNISSIFIEEGTNQRLRRLTDREFFEYTTRDSVGRPNYWRLRGLDDGYPEIELSPTPAGGYTIRYVYNENPKQLTDSDDTVPFAPRILVWGAVKSVLEFDGEDYTEAGREFQRAIMIEKKRQGEGRNYQWGKYATGGLGPGSGGTFRRQSLSGPEISSGVPGDI